MEPSAYSSPSQVRLDEIRKMLISSQFTVTIYNDATDDAVYPPIVTNFVPYPGLIILHMGEAWKVDRVQVLPPHPDSRAAREGGPTLVDVMAVKSTGVHHMAEASVRDE